MISSIGSSGSTSDIASLLRSTSNSSTQRVREQRPPSPTEMFQNMDSDGDGAVTESEFTTAMESMQEAQGSQPPPPPPGGGEPPSSEEMFAAIDSDSDGQISLEELQADLESRKPDEAPDTTSASGPDLSELFEKVDSDADGQIGETEFKKLLEVMQQASEQPAGTTYTKDSTTSSSVTNLLGYA